MNENVTKALTVIDNAKKNGALAFVTREAGLRNDW